MRAYSIFLCSSQTSLFMALQLMGGSQFSIVRYVFHPQQTRTEIATTHSLKN